MENKFPELDLPPADLKIKEDGNGICVWDTCRKKWLVLTGEEWVRQNFIAFLVNGLGMPSQHVAQECPVDLGDGQRADIAVYDRRGKVCLLVECKEPEVELCKETLAQAIRYNSCLKAPYIILTNGLRHLCFEMDGSGCRQMEKFPDFSMFFE